MKIRTKSTGTDKKGVCWSTLNPLVIILRAHFYTGIPRMCVLRSEHPRHLNVWGVLRHCVPNKGLHPLRRYAAILADLVSGNGFARGQSIISMGSTCNHLRMLPIFSCLCVVKHHRW